MIATMKSWRFLFTSIAVAGVSFLGTASTFGWPEAFLTIIPSGLASCAPHFVTAIFGAPPPPPKEVPVIPIVRP